MRKSLQALAPATSVICVRSILACDYEQFEVVVVDNRPESTAAAVMLFEHFADDPRVRYVEECRPGASWATCPSRSSTI